MDESEVELLSVKQKLSLLKGKISGKKEKTNAVGKPTEDIKTSIKEKIQSIFHVEENKSEKQERESEALKLCSKNVSEKSRGFMELKEDSSNLATPSRKIDLGQDIEAVAKKAALFNESSKNDHIHPSNSKPDLGKDFNYDVTKKAEHFLRMAQKEEILGQSPSSVSRITFGEDFQPEVSTKAMYFKEQAEQQKKIVENNQKTNGNIKLKLDYQETERARITSLVTDIKAKQVKMKTRLSNALEKLKEIHESGRTVEWDLKLSESRLKLLCELQKRTEQFQSKAMGKFKALDRKEFFETGMSRQKEINEQTKLSLPPIDPIPLVMCEDGTGKLDVNEEAVEQLRKIQGRIGIVGMAGLFRTGKSFILTRIMQEQEGFPIDSTVRSCTKGIWIWGKPMSTKEIDYLLVLDTEGLGDPKKGDSRHDACIFALALLLSSYLIYNSRGTIDDRTIRELHLVANLTEHIKTKSGGSIHEERERVMPPFCWLVRDFTLNLQLDGEPCTENEYLENCLHVRKESMDPTAQNIRHYLRMMFKERQCVCLIKPTDDDQKLKSLNKVPFHTLKEDFKTRLGLFITQLYADLRPVRLMGQNLNGSMVCSMLEQYISSVNGGAVPDISDTFNSLVEIECANAVKDGRTLYKNAMDQEVKTLGLPIELADLSQLHQKYEKEAISCFNARCIGDSDGEYRTKLQAEIAQYTTRVAEDSSEGEELTGGLYYDFSQRNETESKKHCQELLDKMYANIQTKIAGQLYYPPVGNIEDYNQDQEDVKKRYEETPKKGPKAKEVLFVFFRDKISEAQLLITSNKILSEKDKEIELERQAQQQLELQTQKTREDIERLNEDLMNQQRAYREQVNSMKTQHEQVMHQMRSDFDKEVNRRLDEIQCLSQENYNREAKRLQDEVDEIRRNRDNQMSSYSSTIEQLRQQVQQLNNDIAYLNSLPNKQVKRRRKGGCFAANSSVQIKNSEGHVVTKTLANLRVGDNVESFDPMTGQQTFSEVYFITHDDEVTTFSTRLLGLSFDSDPGQSEIVLDPNHLLYVTKGTDNPRNGFPDDPVASCQVEVGDFLWVRSSNSKFLPLPVMSIRAVRNVAIRHPMTMNHHIVVNGVHASVHMFNERLYRVLTAPLRIAYQCNPQWCEKSLLKKLVRSWDSIEDRIKGILL